MKRLTRLWLAFAKNSLAREMEFRGNFLFKMLMEIGWASTTIFSLEVIFSQTSSLASWSKGEVYLIYALFRISSALSAMLYRKNLFMLSRIVNKGDYDFYLTKPINTYFLTLTRYQSFDRLSQFAVGIALLVFALSFEQVRLSITYPGLIPLFIVSAVFIRLGITVIIHLPVFWTSKLGNVSRLEINLFGTARFPRHVFPPVLRSLLTFVAPVLLAASIPTEIILGKTSLLWALVVFSMAFGLFAASYLLFYQALKHYSSASS